MSLDGAELRNAVLQKTKSEISQCLSQRRGALRALYRITSTLSTLRPPQPEDWICSTPPAQDEQIYLDANDLEQGRRFNDATLPFPIFDIQQPPLPSTLPLDTPAKGASTKSPHVVGAPGLQEQLRAASASPSVTAQALPPESPKGFESANAATSASNSSRPERSSRLATSAVEERATTPRSSTPQSTSGSKSAPLAVQPVQSGVDVSRDAVPEEVIPPTVEDKNAAAFPDASAVVSSSENKAKAPQTVHLPPQVVQEARLKETEQKLEAAATKERKEDEKFTAHTKDGPNDLVSSPSSTVGGYSQATPHAPHHSPDTSPDTESFRRQAGPSLPTDEMLDPAAQQVKEDHERALQKQMNEARRNAREMHSPTPDIEQQLENEQAIRLARDGKDQISSTDAGQSSSLINRAKEAVRDTSSATEKLVLAKSTHDSAIDSLPTPTTIAPEPIAHDEDIAEETQDGTNVTNSHPTPPAENDVDMNDASANQEPKRTVQTDSQASSDSVRRKFATIRSPEHHSTRTALVPRSNNASALISPPRLKSRQSKSGEVSTVVFAKKAPNRGSKALPLHNEDYTSLLGASEDTSRDYLEGLFKYQAHHPPRSAPLQELVNSARKTVTTAGTLAMIREHQDYKILKRVYQLQNANRWSLRQLQKSVEPERPFTHHDQLLLEMKWMRTDFREERSWKKALAATFAGWCADFVNSSQDERVALRINARIPENTKRENHDEDMTDAPTPDLVHSHAHETESESYGDDDELLTPLNANAPAGIFSLDFSDVVMKIERTPASDQMFRELPFYEPILEGSDGNPFSASDPPILPVSKYVTGKLVSQIKGPPKKRSRYDYDSEDEPSTPPSRSGTSAEHSMPSTPGRRLFCRNDLPPEMTDVALFNAENKHVRDRLQAAHQFRPPTEFNMPSVAFFENRIPSQWLWEEDQKLRALVKEYTFNWSLVSQQLSLPSMFVSGSGRRTPWECFERWVQLEGLPAEMSKTQYFRTYQGRLEQANKTVFAQYQAQQQQQQQQGQAPAQPRRRPTTTPIRVERRRENRHLAIIDGMRKLARKRESAAHKQAESQKAAALRKAHEPAAPKNTVHTPQEFSRLKWEREEKLKMRQQQQEMAVRQQLAAQRQAQMQGQAMPNGVNQMQRNGTPGGTNGLPNQMQNASSQQNQNAAAMAARAHQNQQGMQANFANNNIPNMQMGTTGVPQAQMHGNTQNAQRMTQQQQMQAMAAMQRGQFSNNNQQQHQFQLQQQQINMASGMAQGMNMNNIPNANMMASMSNQNLAGNMSAGMNGNMNGNMNLNLNGMSNNAGSPRMNQINGNTQQSSARPQSSGHVPGLMQLQHNLKQQHPEWTDEKCRQTASDQIQHYLRKQQNQRLSAMSAAAGSPGMSPSPQMSNNQFMQQNGGMANSPSGNNAVQNYQAQLVQQQRLIQQRQQAGSPLAMGARPESRSATPQNPQMQQQSPGLQQAQVNRS